MIEHKLLCSKCNCTTFYATKKTDDEISWYFLECIYCGNIEELTEK